MYTRGRLSSMIDEYMSQLPIPPEPAGLYDPIRYSLDAGGKRIRPLLVLMACDLFGGDVREAMACAVALEVYHNFTLLHDDIMDNAPVRRGKPSVHERWDQNTAILSGDAMLIYAYHILEGVPSDMLAPVLREFNKCCLEICEGQQYDMEFEGRDDVTIDEYMNMITLKTSVLLAAGAKTGAMLAGADERDCQTMYEFALQLGLAFQIQDDLLDSYGTAEQLGKNTGGDILEGKKTFLLLTALRKASPEATAELTNLMVDKTIGAEMKIKMVRAVYDRLGVREAAEQEVELRIEAAMAELDKLSAADENKVPLRELAASLIRREK